MEQYPIRPVTITKVSESGSSSQEDLVAVEEPLEIRLRFGAEKHRKEKRLAVTMRTVGHDFELTLGFLFTEGIIQNISDVEVIRYCEEPATEDEIDNVVIVHLKPEVDFDPILMERNFYTTSSCGVCGKSSLEAVENQHCEVINSEVKIDVSVITKLNQSLREEQTVFKHTGGIHAAALFDHVGNLVMVREDIGRHNAVDKLIGAALAKNSFPLSEYQLWVSGRAGFELVQKAVAAGLPVMSAVGAPSSLAVDLAQRFRLTLIGFLRADRMNIYSEADRIVLA